MLEEEMGLGHRKRAIDASGGGTVVDDDEVCGAPCLEDTTWA